MVWLRRHLLRPLAHPPDTVHVLQTYNLLMYGFFVGRMIMNGGEANSIGAQSITMLRSLQVAGCITAARWVYLSK